MRDLVIVGGGITGLAAAHRFELLNPGADTMLLEATGRLGGRIRTEHVDGYAIECGPDCFLSRKPRGVGICRDLDVEGELIGRDERHKRTYILRRGTLHPLPEGMTGLVPTNREALGESSLLSEDGKARVAAECDVPAADIPGDESVASFVVRRFGREAFERLMEPLLSGIYAGRAEELSLAATFPQLRSLEVKHGSVTQGLLAASAKSATDSHQGNASAQSDDAVLPPFVSFPDGMERLVHALSDAIETVEIRRKATAIRIEGRPGGYRLIVRDEHGTEGEVGARAVLFTAPLYSTAEIVRSFDPDLASSLETVPYASTALVNMAFPVEALHALSGYGYVIPRIESREALACTWSSMKWPGRAPEGSMLLRVYIGRYGDEDPTARDDEELVAIARDEIAQTMQVTADPTLTRVDRHRRGIPQYTMGHRERVSTIESQFASHAGLFSAGAAFGGVGIPDCISSGEDAVDRIAAYLSAV